MTCDVTSEGQARENFRMRDDWFHSLTKLSSDWYWETNEEGGFTFMSDSILRIFGVPSSCFIGKMRNHIAIDAGRREWKAANFVGVTQDNCIGRILWEIVPRILMSATFPYYHEAMRTGRPCFCEVYSEPAKKWIEVRIYAREDGLSVYVHDVTARLEAESAIHMETSASVLKRLKQLGLQLSVDDFGTGYSGLAYLRSLPFDTLKLDRSFISGRGEEIGNFKFVKAFVDLAHAINLSVLAEGVETSDTPQLLRDAACDEEQGYLFAKPLPIRERGTFLLGL